MQIASLQKLSLIDFPGRLACTIFLCGCNFKCGFCHNPELVLPEGRIREIHESDILDFLKKRKKYLDGVCITGGEPLVNKDILKFLEKIKELNYLVKLDTNGSNPKLLKELIDKKLIDFVALDIKSDNESYDLLCGVEVDLKKIEESIKIIAESGVDHEFRTTVVRGFHSKENLKMVGEWLVRIIGGKPTKFCIQNFIPRQGKLVDDKFEKISSFENSELEEMKNSVSDYFNKVEIRS